MVASCNEDRAPEMTVTGAFSGAFCLKAGGMMEGYMTIGETAEKWKLTKRRVQKMCADGEIEGAIKFGTVWAVPRDVTRPKDGRVTTGEYRNWRKNG